MDGDVPLIFKFTLANGIDPDVENSAFEYGFRVN